jgi:enediyne biosynthesis thioesterase
VEEMMGAELEMQDRRRHERLSTLIPGILLATEGAGERDLSPDRVVRGFKMVARNISESGLLVSASIKVERLRKFNGSVFNAVLGTGANPRLLSTRAKLVWSKRPDEPTNGEALVGLVFARGVKERSIQHVLDRVRREGALYRQFSVSRTIYFGDTNVEGNVYFAKFFEWQGMAREEFYRQALPGYLEFLKSGVRIITADANIKFKSQLVLFDEISIEVRIRSIGVANLELAFVYRKKDTRDIVAVGSQTLAFTDTSGKVVQVPAEIMKAGQLYLDPYEGITTYFGFGKAVD